MMQKRVARCTPGSQPVACHMTWKKRRRKKQRSKKQNSGKTKEQKSKKAKKQKQNKQRTNLHLDCGEPANLDFQSLCAMGLE